MLCGYLRATLRATLREHPQGEQVVVLEPGAAFDLEPGAPGSR